MKQLKFLMVALTLLMGISLTSCLGDNDPTVTEPALGRVTNLFPYTFETSNGVKFVATNNIESTTSLKMNMGDIVEFTFTYNSDEQQITETNKTINAQITVYRNLSICTNATVTDNDGSEEAYENATINEILVNEGSKMLYFDRNTLLIPIVFLAKEREDKHEFTLVYNNSIVNEQENDDVLVLYLRHKNSEEKPTESVGLYKAFDIRYILNVYGKTPTKIRVYANVTDKFGSCDLADAKEELQYKEIDYKSVFEK